MRKKIIEPIDKDLLAAELMHCRFLKTTRHGSKEIYLFDYRDSKHLMLEVGRLRELTFRDAGSGTGREADIDGYDMGDFPYQQLIVWDPREKEMVGGYRYLECAKVTSKGTDFLSSSGLFHFSKKFRQDYFPCSIELGRSWIQPKYQCRTGNRKGLFSLENLWEGIGCVIASTPSVKYLFGKVTIQTQYDPEARDLLLGFMGHYFPGREALMRPHEALPGNFEHVTGLFRNHDFQRGLQLLRTLLKECGEHIPPLINAYLKLSPTLRTFGSTVNTSLGNVVDTAILISVADICGEKKKRYLTAGKGVKRAA